MVLILGVLGEASPADAEPRLMYHRGGMAVGPENTIAGIDLAFADLADSVEIDLRMTSDGEFVLMHDAAVDRTTDGTGLVADMTLAEIKALDAGSWKGPQFAGEQVPTLAEALEAVAAHGGSVLLDRKAGSQSSAAQVVAQSSLPATQVFAASTGLGGINIWISDLPGVKVIWVPFLNSLPVEKDDFDQPLFDDLIARGAWGVSLVHDSLFSYDFVQMLHANGLKGHRLQKTSSLDDHLLAVTIPIDQLDTRHPSVYLQALSMLPSVPAAPTAYRMLGALGLLVAASWLTARRRAVGPSG